MAGELAYTKVSTPFDGPGVAVYRWQGLTANQCGARLAVAPYADKTIYVCGTFGGAVTLRGSNIVDVSAPQQPLPNENTAAHWFPLVDPQGNPISFTAFGGEAILEHTYWVSPLAAAAVSAVDVWLFVGSSR